MIRLLRIIIVILLLPVNIVMDIIGNIHMMLRNIVLITEGKSLIDISVQIGEEKIAKMQGNIDSINESKKFLGMDDKEE